MTYASKGLSAGAIGVMRGIGVALIVAGSVVMLGGGLFVGPPIFLGGVLLVRAANRQARIQSGR